MNRSGVEDDRSQDHGHRSAIEGQERPERPYRRPMATSVAGPWPYVGRGQRRMLIASVIVIVGSVLPWVDTVAGVFLGVEGAGLWTLAAGGIGLAGGVLRRRRLVIAHAVVVAVVPLVLATWQLMRLLGLCGGGACVPGIGLGLVLFGGILAIAALHQLLAER